MGGGGAEVSARERPGEQRSAAPQAGAPAVSLAGVAGAGAEAGGPGPIWACGPDLGLVGWEAGLDVSPGVGDVRALLPQFKPEEREWWPQCFVPAVLRCLVPRRDGVGVRVFA